MEPGTRVNLLDRDGRVVPVDNARVVRVEPNPEWTSVRFTEHGETRTMEWATSQIRRR